MATILLRPSRVQYDASTTVLRLYHDQPRHPYDSTTIHTIILRSRYALHTLVPRLYCALSYLILIYFTTPILLTLVAYFLMKRVCVTIL